MKIKNLVLATALIFSVSTFAQKEQLKSAEKSMKDGNSAEAKETLSKVEYMVTNADDVQKAQYYFLLGNASLDLAKKKINASQNFIDAAKAYNELVEIENNSGKIKYSTQAQASLLEVKTELYNGALADDKVKKYKESALKLYEVYQLDKNDTIMLYYAAGNAVNSQDNDLALDYYNKLKNLNFSGKGISYIAKSKMTDEDQTFSSKSDRDQAVALGTHTNPRMEKIASKRGEIFKQISSIYIQKGDLPAAKKAIADARRANPEDTSLILTEADLYLQTKDFVTYKKLIKEVLSTNQNNAALYFNLGVISADSKEPEGKSDAEKYYMKAIEIDPNYKGAYINLAVLKLEGEGKIVDEMNKLSTSPSDNKKFDVLKAKREAMYKSALPYLEKAEELFGGDKDVKSALLNVYNALDMTDKFKALKAKK